MSEDKIFIKGKEIKRHPEFKMYGASEDGNVYRIDRGYKLTKTYNKRAKYYYIRVSQDNTPRTLRLHIFVAKCWICNPKNYRVVNHINGNKLDCRVSNLEWVTDSQNQRHALSLGLKQKGEKLYNSKLTDEQVHKICKLLEEGYRVVDLAKMFNVNKDNIRKVRDGSCYFHIRKLYVNIPHRFSTEYSVGTVQWVCDKILEGMADARIAKECRNTSLTTIDVKRIRNKIRYSDISDKYF